MTTLYSKINPMRLGSAIKPFKVSEMFQASSSLIVEPTTINAIYKIL